MFGAYSANQWTHDPSRRATVGESRSDVSSLLLRTVLHDTTPIAAMPPIYHLWFDSRRRDERCCCASCRDITDIIHSIATACSTWDRT